MNRNCPVFRTRSCPSAAFSSTSVTRSQKVFLSLPMRTFLINNASLPSSSGGPKRRRRNPPVERVCRCLLDPCNIYVIPSTFTVPDPLSSNPRSGLFRSSLKSTTVGRAPSLIRSIIRSFGRGIFSYRRRMAICLTSGAVSSTSAEATPEVAEAEPYLGPTSDLLTAMEALSSTRTFTQMCLFLENNCNHFRGPEVAALVLQAANVSELAAQRQVAVAMSVAERRSSELTAMGDGGDMNVQMLAGAVEEVLSGGGTGRADGGTDEDTVLDELDAADQLLGWAMPLLRANIKRYPPDAVSALLASLAQLEQYDQRLMELAAEVFKNDPQDWLRRASPPAAPKYAAEDDAYDSRSSTLGSDPWFTLVSLASAYARLGHYDRDLMTAIAKLAVQLMPQVSERAEAEDVATAALIAQAEADGAPISDNGGGFKVTGTVVALVSSFLEVNHLDPALMQAAGEHLAACSHQLDQNAIAQVLLVFASFNARNPPFYSLMLRRLLDAAEATAEAEAAEAEAAGLGRWEGSESVLNRGPALQPRAAGALYRACVLLKAMGEFPELLHEETPAAVTPEAPAAGAPNVGRQLAVLLRRCLGVCPLASLQATPLGRPTPQQLEQANAVPELVEAWEATGLLTVPQILSTLQELPFVEPLPPSALTTSPPEPYGKRDSCDADGDKGDDEDDGVIGGPDAVAWVPPDALLTYNAYGSGSSARIAIKALDEKLHCCRNIGMDSDLDRDRPGPRSRGATAAMTSSTAENSCGTQRRRGRLLRLRGNAWSELRCLETWGWKVLVVPVGFWGEMDPGARSTWLVRQLEQLAAEAEADGPRQSGLAEVLPSEIWV